LEMATGTYVAVSLGVGCFGVSLLELMFGGLAMGRDIMIFGLVTTGTFVALRRLFQRKNDAHVVEGDINKY
ncbi:MAG TPA: hypothetical protein PLT25_09265, partial [Acidocella sp.]|nr:hypothetical protein [Acidocella sp.]